MSEADVNNRIAILTHQLAETRIQIEEVTEVYNNLLSALGQKIGLTSDLLSRGEVAYAQRVLNAIADGLRKVSRQIVHH